MLFEDWGLIDYQSALSRQLQYVEVVYTTPEHPGFLIFCKHPAVVTVGRQTLPEDVFSWVGPVIEVSRGGRATYHGPSQRVVYPIVNLKNPRQGRGSQEIRGFIRGLEQAIILTLKSFEIESHGKTQVDSENNLSDTGVWIDDKKIASLGIAVKHWISFHGAAINIAADKDAFQGLNPCGYSSSIMTSVEQVLGREINNVQFDEILKSNCLNLL